MQSVLTQPVAQPSVGCWQGFCQMISKAATWAANFFSALGAGIVMFARIYSRELIIGGIAFAAGLLIALIFNRCCGCCNKPAEEVEGSQFNSPRVVPRETLEAEEVRGN